MEVNRDFNTIVVAESIGLKWNGRVIEKARLSSVVLPALPITRAAKEITDTDNMQNFMERKATSRKARLENLVVPGTCIQFALLVWNLRVFADLPEFMPVCSYCADPDITHHAGTCFP